MQHQCIFWKYDFAQNVLVAMKVNDFWRSRMQQLSNKSSNINVESMLESMLKTMLYKCCKHVVKMDQNMDPKSTNNDQRINAKIDATIVQM